MNTRHRAVLAIAGIVSYSCLPQIPHLLGVKNGGPSAWLATPGIVVVMIFALASPRAGRLLRLSIPSLLRRVSYSLYLYHGIVILAALNIGYGRVPIGVLILLMFMASLAVSTLSYYWIEVPAMALGARLSRRLDRSKNQMTGEAIPQRP